MANIEIGKHDGAKGVSKTRSLEVNMTQVNIQIDYELATFRHLNLETQQHARKYSKVVLVRYKSKVEGGDPVYSHTRPEESPVEWEQERKVIVDGGVSCRPYYETIKGQRLCWAKEDPRAG